MMEAISNYTCKFFSQLHMQITGLAAPIAPAPAPAPAAAAPAPAAAAPAQPVAPTTAGEAWSVLSEPFTNCKHETMCTCTCKCVWICRPEAQDAAPLPNLFHERGERQPPWQNSRTLQQGWISRLRGTGQGLFGSRAVNSLCPCRSLDTRLFGDGDF